MATDAAETWAIHAEFKETKDKLPTTYLPTTAIVAELRRSLAERGVSERCNGCSLSMEFGERLKNRQLCDWETLKDAGLFHGARVRVWANPPRLLATASADGTARIWSAITGECIHVLLAGQEAVVSAAPSRHSGSQLGSARTPISPSDSGTRSVCAEDEDESPGRTPLTAGRPKVKSTRDDGSLPDEDARSQTSLAQTSTVRTDSQAVSEAGPVGAKVSEAAFSPNGDFVVTASDSTMAKIWDVTSGECTMTLAAHTDLVRTASFSADAKFVVTASDDDTAIIWDAWNGEQKHVLSNHGHYVRFACFSPCGHFVLTASLDCDAKTWDVATGECLVTLSSHRHFIRCASWSSCSGGIATASSDGTAKVWNAETGECLETCKGHQGTVYSAVFSSSGHLLLTASFDCTAKLWNVLDGECVNTLVGHGSVVASAEFSHVGDRIVTSSYDFTAKIWDAESAHCLFTLSGHRGNVVFAIFSADDDDVITTSHDGAARIWKSHTGCCAHTLVGHGRAVLKGDLVSW